MNVSPVFAQAELMTSVLLCIASKDDGIVVIALLATIAIVVYLKLRLRNPK